MKVLPHISMLFQQVTNYSKINFGQVFFSSLISLSFFHSLLYGNLAPRFLFIQIYIYIFLFILRLFIRLFVHSFVFPFFHSFSLDLLNNLERNAWQEKSAFMRNTSFCVAISSQLVIFFFPFLFLFFFSF